MPMKENITTGKSSIPGPMGDLVFGDPSSSPAAEASAWVDGTAWPLPLAKAGTPDLHSSTKSFACIIGQDPKMKAIFSQILDAAPYDYAVHLSGATGTGKELVARAIHDYSSRRRGAFVAVNCGALPENLVESELFGHVKGAFTGAVRSRKGRFERAHHGTLFLDEVADLPPYIQVRLLRVLQYGRFEKVGGEGSIGVDARVISATNKPLKAEMKAGRFRQDLFNRLNVVPIHMPPLKARRGDIVLLARHFLHLAATRYHRRSVAFTDQALSAMQRHDWPGNVRELQNTVHFALVRARGRMIDVTHLPPAVQTAAAPTSTRRLDLHRCRGSQLL